MIHEKETFKSYKHWTKLSKKAEGAPLDWDLVRDGGSKAGSGSAAGTQRNTRGDREGHTKGDFIRGGTPLRGLQL